MKRKRKKIKQRRKRKDARKASSKKSRRKNKRALRKPLTARRKARPKKQSKLREPKRKPSKAKSIKPIDANALVKLADDILNSATNSGDVPARPRHGYMPKELIGLEAVVKSEVKRQFKHNKDDRSSFKIDEKQMKAALKEYIPDDPRLLRKGMSFAFEWAEFIRYSNGLKTLESSVEEFKKTIQLKKLKESSDQKA